MDASLELKTGELQFSLLQGTHADNKSPIAECSYEKGALRLQDLGYFNLARMKRQAQAGEYWLSRLQPGTHLFDDKGNLIDLPRYLLNKAKEKTIQIELSATVGAKEHVKARVLLWKLPEEAAARRRAKLELFF